MSGGAPEAGAVDDRAPGGRHVHVVRDPLGGAFRNLMDLARDQRSRGARVGLISAAPGPDVDSSAIAEVFDLGWSRIRSPRAPGLADVAGALAVRRILRTLRPDVVHAHGAKAGLYVRLQGVGARVYSPHGGSLHYSGLASLPFRWIERVLVARTDGLVLVSESERRTFEARIGALPEHAATILHGLQPEEFEELEPTPLTHDLCYVGHLRDLKGVGDLIDALALLKARGIAPRTLIVGPGTAADVARYAARIAEAQLDAVELRAGSARPREVFAASGLGVMPSRGEALGYLAIEACAMGMPLLATRAGGLPEVFGPTASDMPPPGDPEALAEALSAALADPQRCHRLARERRAHALEAFGVERMFTETDALYRRALRSAGSRGRRG